MLAVALMLSSCAEKKTFKKCDGTSFVASPYGWDGGHCPNEYQRKFLAETYYLYREIYHQLILDMSKNKNMYCNVYLDETLTCDESGEPIKVERVE